MAGVRVTIAVAQIAATFALAGGAACRQAAEADPIGAARSGLTAPTGWVAMPAIAEAVATAARAPGVIVDGSEAWGEPAMGCYAAWLAIHGDHAIAADALATQIVAGFGGAGNGSGAGAIVLHDMRAGSGADANRVELAFELAPYHGRLRATLSANDASSLTALACFANAREPAACDAACATLIGGAR